MRKPTQLILTGFLSIVIAFVLLEISLRVFDPIGVRYYFDSRRYFKAMSPDPDFAYIHTSGYRRKLQGVDVVINSHGFRGPEFDVEKLEGERRVMILGDSVVFGWGAPQDSIFSAVLQERLNDESKHWRVISAGVGSWNTRTEYEFLKKTGVGYNLDLLVLIVVPNDVEPNSAGRTVVKRDRLIETVHVSLPLRVVRFIGRRSYAFSAFYHVLKTQTQSERLTNIYSSDSPAWEDARDALSGIIDICGREDIELFVFLYADVSTDFSKAFYRAYHDFLSARDVPVYRMPEQVYERRFRNSFIDGHPNSAAHRLIAEEVLRVIRRWL